MEQAHGHQFRFLEVEEAERDPKRRVRRLARGSYWLYGRSEAGTYIAILFRVWQQRRFGITARLMDDSERRFYSG